MSEGDIGDAMKRYFAACQAGDRQRADAGLGAIVWLMNNQGGPAWKSAWTPDEMAAVFHAAGGPRRPPMTTGREAEHDEG
ncbi:MAG: hypothetical protein LBU23_00515 [Planctomycetota bacterium]|jgi:hypothetical protein|nr:hypothetical protein [Planctomycetota bacterium]